jgi:hypothetical protein
VTWTDIAPALLWAVTLITGAAGVRAHLSTRRLVRTRTRLDNMLQQAAEDRAFARWAEYTMLTVTDREGIIWATTLPEFWKSGEWDRIWDHPAAASFWHAHPDTLARWRNEITEITEHREDPPSA